MTTVRRLLAVGAFLTLIAWLCTPSQGEPTAKPGTAAAAAARPAAAGATADDDAVAAAESRFDLPGVQVYQPVKGAAVFALPLQPKLPAAKARPRDLIVVASSSAGMAGQPWIATRQIAEAALRGAGPDDRVALWIAGDPKATRCLTAVKGRGDFMAPTADKADEKRLTVALKKFRTEVTPMGMVDLDDALRRVAESFDGDKNRQRVILFLGDGYSLANPLGATKRFELARKFARARIGFFPVPLGANLDAENLHGLATGTGGAVLRVRVDEEKLEDALKRFRTAFDAPVLYDARLTKLPDGATDICPRELPPLRADAPTLLAGRLATPGKTFAGTITGTPAGAAAPITVNINVPVYAADTDNFFLLTMVTQWQKAKDRSALLRADRALGQAYVQTRLQHRELHLAAQLALEKNELEAAGRLFAQARQLAPHDPEAGYGLKVVDGLKSGKVNPKALRARLERSRKEMERLEKIGGKARLRKVGLVELAALEKDEVPGGGVGGVGGAAEERDAEALLRAHRDRVIVEEQRMTQLAEDAIRRARREVYGGDAAAVAELLRGTLARVQDHPDLTERTRDALAGRLEASLREAATQARVVALRRADESQAAAVLRAEVERERQLKTFEERIEAQYRVFKGLMNEARFEEATKQAVIEGLFGMAQEARRKGLPVPLVTQAAYDVTLAGYHIQKNMELKRLREERFLSVMLTVEKSFVPFPDEPGIYFPPLATWKAIRDLRKEKYEVSSLPDNEQGRREANAIYKLLQEPIATAKFTTPMSLKDALEQFGDIFGAKGKELPILIDKRALNEEKEDAEDPYDTQVSLPPVPRKMTMGTALRLILSQIKTNNATYLIRRNHIEITSIKRMTDDKVLRVYPVGDLVIPISQMGGMMMGGMGMMGMGGGMMGMGGGMMGMMGMGGGMGMMGMGGMPMGGMGMMGMGGMPMGGMGMGGMGMMGMGGMGMMGMGGMPMGGMGMMGMGGMPMGGMGMMGMPMGGMGMGGMGMMGMPMGGMGMMGMGGMGMMGMGGMMAMGGMGGMMGSFRGGSFTGGFNGSLGMMGASQAMSLITTITQVVAPGEWFKIAQPDPFAPMVFPGLGMLGMPAGMVGGMGGFGAGPPPAPVEEGGPADIQQANTISFFPPSLALIVRAPSRVHTTATGGLIGGRGRRIEGAAALERPGVDVIARGPGAKKDPAIRVGGARETAVAKLKKRTPVDPKVWQEELEKGGIPPGLVLATADFLFEAGEFKHAAEFLKANLRVGIVVRPWVYESLAVALEASGGDPEDVRRARASAAALDPRDATGFLKAARAMAQGKQYDRALALCRQAALLEPNQPAAYEQALAYADLGKDGTAMAWAAGKLVSQDWPADNGLLHGKAGLRAKALEATLARGGKAAEADRLRTALARLRQRDLVIELSWDNGVEPCELELLVKEPSGSVCSLDQKQTPGGGTLLENALTAKQPSTIYTAAEAFSGDYEVTVRKVFGSPLGGKARLVIKQHSGTDRQVLRMEAVVLGKRNTFKVALASGRRTELAVVSPQAPRRQTEQTQPASKKPGDVLTELRGIANPQFSGRVIGTRAAVGSPGARLPAAPQSKTPPATVYQSAVPTGGAGVSLSTRLQVTPGAGEARIVLQPVFQTAGRGQPAVNLPFIPGGADNP